MSAGLYYCRLWEKVFSQRANPFHTTLVATYLSAGIQRLGRGQDQGNLRTRAAKMNSTSPSPRWTDCAPFILLGFR